MYMAHPKIDPLAKRLYAFGYDLVGPLSIERVYM
jgi:carotenoid cleavage dioxygenase-like enzyme